MSEEERVNLDAPPTGNNHVDPPDFPIPSLRKFMLPNQIVMHKSFEAPSLRELDIAINDWVLKTAAVIAIPSQLNKQVDENGVVSYLTTFTYIHAAAGTENG